MPLACVARSTNSDGLHVAFALDDSSRAALQSMLQRLALREPPEMAKA
ncbi:MAG TPA: hypothetical protein VGG99_05320 [Acetobacteraceae bacterium]